jgi:hypothetical protein
MGSKRRLRGRRERRVGRRTDDIERLSGKLAYILEQVVGLRHAKAEESADRIFMNILGVADHRDVQEAYELFKNISNAVSDKIWIDWEE